MELIASLIATALLVVPLWRICGRAGFNPALSLLFLVPGLGFFIVTAILGFAQWPNLKSRGSA